MYKKIIPVFALATAAILLFKSADKSEIAAEIQPTDSVKTEVVAQKNSAIVAEKAVVASIDHENTPDLNQKIEYFFNEIPKINSIKHATSHEVHVLPAQVRDAGQYLAEMREFFVKHPQSAVAEMNFYLKCASDIDLFDSVRAICAARTSEKYKRITGHKMSPMIFGKRIGDLQRHVKL